MNTKQTNNVTMLKTVDAYLDQNTSVWSAMTPLATAIQSLKTKIGDIDIAAQKQQTPSGATDDKAEARDALEDVLFLACEALAVLAHNSGDRDLLALTAGTPHAFGSMGPEKCLPSANNGLSGGNNTKTELTTLPVFPC